MLTSDQQNNNHSNNTKKKKKSTLPDRVAGFYYKHGLFLSSYPTCASSISIVVVLFCCFPLLNIPFPGTIPTKIILPYKAGSPITTAAASIAEINQDDNNTSEANRIINNKFTSFALNSIKIHNLSLLEPPFPPWARLDPFVYIQQIVLRASVQPWTDSLMLTDAFRGPLYEVYKLLEFVRNHEDENKTNLGHICLHVENVKQSNKENLFPQYNCLILSPANFWQQSTNTFKKDPSLLNTIFQNHNLQKTKVSTAEMLFGMPLRDTGVKRYPMRCRPRIIQYAITLVLKSNDQHYLDSLKLKLQKIYPLHQKTSETNAEGSNPKPPQSSVMFIYYPGEFNLLEFLPLCCAFIIQFLYVYFSVRKIDVIRSRFILAVSSVITVLGSLVMSLGLCFFFGLTISMQSRSVFPYLVILVGLENVLVLTKSVVTTDDNLDVKIRVAQGLSIEGWSITKNLLTEITILTIGLATFVPVIQEFCIFAIVGLLSDYFLQMLFFSTVLAMDIKRVEYSAEVKQLPKILNHTFYQNKNLVNYKYASTTTSPTTSAGIINRSRSHPKLSSLDVKQQQQQATDVIATTTHAQVEKKIPKRLRVVNFWARTRFFQRGFMIWMVLWISNIIYNSGLIEEIFVIDKNNSFSTTKFRTNFNGDSDIITNLDNNLNSKENMNNVPENSFGGADSSAGVSKLPELLAEESLSNSTEQPNRLRHPEFETNFHLSNFHWASIMKQYNISVSGHYVTILPSIRLSYAVPPEMVVHLRNPNEKAPQHFQWKALAVALDPIDFNDLESDEILPPINPTGKAPLYPKTPMELLLTGILCAVSVFVLAYTMVVLYRCICSRNYAEWRASWNDTEVIETKTERVLEAHPIQVNGHTHRIECLVTDGNMIASSCLQGQLKIWDATNGEQVSQIDRRKYFKQQKEEYYLLQQQQQQHKLGSEMSTQPNSLNSNGSASPPPSHLTVTVSNNKESTSSTSSSMSTSPPKLINYSSTPNPKMSSIKNKINFKFSSQDLQDPKQNDFQLQYQKYFNQSSATILSNHHLFSNGHGDNGGEVEEFGGSNEHMYHQYSTDHKLGFSNNSNSRQQQPKHRRNHSYSNTLVNRKNISFDLDYPINSATKSNRSSLSSSPHSSQFRSQQQHQSPNEAVSRKFYNLSPIWCLDFLDNLIVIGCADGRLEFWEGTTGSIKCIYENQTTYSNGVTNIKLAGDKLIVARLNGRLDFLRLETYTQGRQIDWSFTSAYRRTHTRTGSAGSLGSAMPSHNTSTTNSVHLTEELRCVLESQLQGHQQPITCLEVVGNTVLTGSQDHTLKVFRLESTSLLYTLHGHYGPITSVFIDSYQSGTGGSGSQDGLLCVWDLITGACMYKIQAHYDAIVSLVCTPSYVISLGLDERLRVWERFQGHLLNTINVMHAYSGVLMLTPSLLVTGKPGSLVVWDVHTGEPAREVKLDCANQRLCPKYMLSACGSVICDFGNQLRIVRFPLVAADKCE